MGMGMGPVNHHNGHKKINQKLTKPKTTKKQPKTR